VNQMKEQVSREECEAILAERGLPDHIYDLARAHLALLDLQDKRRDAIAEALGCLFVIAKGEHEIAAKDLAAIGIAEIHKLSVGENITPRQALLDECESLRKDKERLDRVLDILQSFGVDGLFDIIWKPHKAFTREAIDAAISENAAPGFTGWVIGNNYKQLGTVDTPEQIREMAQALAPRYELARWKWFDCGIPSADKIAYSIMRETPQCLDFVATGGFCITREGPHLFLSVDKRLAPANGPASADDTSRDAKQGGESVPGAGE